VDNNIQRRLQIFSRIYLLYNASQSVEHFLFNSSNLTMRTKFVAIKKLFEYNTA
jgi:hypothetical protein